MDPLHTPRTRIDAIDADILRLIEQRLQAVDEVRKNKTTKTPLDPAREHELLSRLQENTRVEPGDVESIFRAIMGAALRRQGGLKVAFLGPEGTWSHRAVRERFGSGADAVPCEDLESVVEAFVSGAAGNAVVPVQNSRTGPILEGLRLVQDRPVSVVGRMDLRVRQGLVGAGGDAPVRVVHSHPQALAQCRDALREVAPGARLVAASSTSAAVREALAAGEHAVADAELARSLDAPVRVEVLAESRTRFLVLGHEATRPTGRDRTMLVLRIRDEPGSLTDALVALSDRGVDLRWVQAMPCPEAPAGTEFVMELSGHREDAAMATALGDLHKRSLAVRVLGSYPVLEA